MARLVMRGGLLNISCAQPRNPPFKPQAFPRLRRRRGFPVPRENRLFDVGREKGEERKRKKEKESDKERNKTKQGGGKGK